MSPPLRNKNEATGDGCYPPTRFTRNGASPYFIGKYRMSRKCVDKNEHKLTRFGFGGEGFMLEKQQEVSSLASNTLNGSNGMSFDFHDDPKLRRVKEVIVSIVDSVSCFFCFPFSHAFV